MQRSLSMANLNGDHSGPIYRNPARDELGDDQSLLDRSLHTQSVVYETNNDPNHSRGLPLPPLPNGQSNGYHARPHKHAITIEQFDVTNRYKSLPIWFREYERMANANNWTELDKACMLYFNMTPESRNFFSDLFEDEDLIYNELRDQLISKRRSHLRDNIDTDELNRRVFGGKGNENETLDTYFIEMIGLMDIIDDKMGFENRRNYIINGLPEKLKKHVKLGEYKETENMRKLKEYINRKMNALPNETSKKKSVRFETDNYSQKNGHNSYANRNRADTFNRYNGQNRNNEGRRYDDNQDNHGNQPRGNGRRYTFDNQRYAYESQGNEYGRQRNNYGQAPYRYNEYPEEYDQRGYSGDIQVRRRVRFEDQLNQNDLYQSHDGNEPGYMREESRNYLGNHYPKNGGQANRNDARPSNRNNENQYNRYNGERQVADRGNGRQMSDRNNERSRAGRSNSYASQTRRGMQNGNVRNGVYAINDTRNNNDSQTSEEISKNRRPIFEWTTDGKPICNLCKEAGHMAFQCPNKSKRLGN